MSHMMKLTLLFAVGREEVVEAPTSPGETDDEAFDEVVKTWLHALICPNEQHLMQFRIPVLGTKLVIFPTALVGFRQGGGETQQ